MREQLEKKLQHEIREIEMALSALTRAPDRSTGHAFVIFNLT